jgi:DNA-binding CsgD family transcriptional regulator
MNASTAVTTTVTTNSSVSPSTVIAIPRLHQSPPLTHRIVEDTLSHVLDTLLDGVLIASTDRQLVQANQPGLFLCRQLDSALLDSAQVPLPVWQICQSLLHYSQRYVDDDAIVEEEVRIDIFTRIRVRVGWIKVHETDSSFLLIVMEDRTRLTNQIALAEARSYQLTPRETEVWQLKCAGLTYKEIAAELFITVDTVKKHIKNINLKRNTVLS